MALTSHQLQLLLPAASAGRAGEFLAPLNAAMHEAEISVALPRVEHFLAQLLHESEGLVYWSEIWGPTDTQRLYEPPSGKAVRLGNTQAGDGYRYRGRGPIQVTGRSNYARYGHELGLDLVHHPELLEQPGPGFRAAAAFWKDHGCNALADHGDIEGITHMINGGLNGLEDRMRWLQRVKHVFEGGS